MKYSKRKIISLIIPVFLILIVPVLLALIEKIIRKHDIITTKNSLFIIGIFIAVIGLILFLLSMSAKFKMIESGSDLKSKLVFCDIYCMVRNPLILSEIIIQVGESILFFSYSIFSLAVINFIVHSLYFVLFSEPSFEKIFGKGYTDYKKNVSRWTPRLKPWKLQIEILALTEKQETMTNKVTKI